MRGDARRGGCGHYFRRGVCGRFDRAAAGCAAPPAGLVRLPGDSAYRGRARDRGERAAARHAPPAGQYFSPGTAHPPETLVGTLEIALRGRQRQYQIRDQMQQFALAQEALLRSEKLAVTGRLAASIAHEVNNPLEAVTNLLFLMRGDAVARAEGAILGHGRAGTGAGGRDYQADAALLSRAGAGASHAGVRGAGLGAAAL